MLGGFYLGFLYLGESGATTSVLTAGATISGDSTATSSLSRITFGSVSVSGDATATSTSKAIIFSSSTVSGDSTASASVVRIVLVSSTISGDATSTSTLSHIALAFGTISGDSVATSTDRANIFFYGTVSGDAVAFSSDLAKIFIHPGAVVGDSIIVGNIVTTIVLNSIVSGDSRTSGILYRGAYLLTSPSVVYKFAPKKRLDTKDILPLDIEQGPLVPLQPDNLGTWEEITPGVTPSWPG